MERFCGGDGGDMAVGKKWQMWGEDYLVGREWGIGRGEIRI